MKEKTTQDRFKSFFRTESVRLNEQSLLSFAANTRPGMLGCLVEELDLVGLVYNPVQLENILTTKTRTVTKRNGPMTMSTEERCGADELVKVQKDLDTLNEAKHSAEQLHNDGRDVELLAQTFENLKANGWSPLRKLRTLIKVFRDDAVTEIDPLEGGSYKLIWQKAAETLRTTLSALSNSGLAVDELDAFSEVHRCAVAANELSPIDTTNESLNSVLGKMTTFSIGISNRDIPKTEEQILEFERPVFPSFRTYKAQTPRDPTIMKAEADDEDNFTGLSNLLALSPNLETLDLHFYNLDSPPVETHNPKLFTRILETTTFSTLTALRLRGFHLHSQDLLRSITRSPLRKLRLENLHLITGTWRSLFAFIAEGPQGYDWILVDDLFEGSRLLYFSSEGDGKPKFPSLCGTKGTNGVLRRGEDAKRRVEFHFAAERPFGSPQVYHWHVRRQIEYGPPDGL